MSEWNEQEHPRDEHGKFGEGETSTPHGKTLKAWVGKSGAKMPTQLYYRVHHDDLPKFSANAAYSRPWGEHGTAKDNRGYSALKSAEELHHYFEQRGGVPANARVVAFEGKEVGVGEDNESLVIPTKVHGWIKGEHLEHAARAEREGSSLVHDQMAFLAKHATKAEPKIDKKALKAKREEAEKSKRHDYVTKELERYHANPEEFRKEMGHYADVIVDSLKAEHATFAKSLRAWAK